MTIRGSTQALGALAFWASAWVMAAGGGSHETADAKPLTLESVSVTATGNPIAPFEYPGMVSVVDREAIRERQPSTLEGVLGGIPNVSFTGGPRRTGEVPGIRGLSGPDVVVTLDGARQNFLSGHDGRLFVDPSLLREAEVVRGPASALYGSGATGGVIALRTVRARDLLAPGDNAGVRLRGGYQGVNHERHGGVTLYGQPGPGVGVLADISRRDSGTIELGDGSELRNSDDDIHSGLLKGNWRTDGYGAFELSLQRFDNDAREPNNGQGAGGDNSVAKDIRSDTARLRYTLDPDSPWLDLDALVYRSEHNVDERRLDDDGEGPVGERLERTVETTGVRVDNSTRLGLGDASAVTFTYGVEAYTDEQTATASSGPRGSVPDGEFDFRAAYAQAQLRWNRPAGLPGELLILPGLRFDAFEASGPGRATLDDEEISPRLGLTYRPTPLTMLFANRADAFRAPTINEIFPTGVHFTIPGFGVNNFVPNTDLAPQRTETVEFGGGVEFEDLLVDGDTFEFKITHFETDGEDFIDTAVSQPAPPACSPPNCNGTTRSVNVASVELRGQEAQASYRAGNLRAALGFSRIDGENTRTGEKLGVLTPARLTLDLRYALPSIDSTIGGRFVAADEFDKVDDPAERRDAYQVVDVFYAWQPRQPAWRGLTVRLGVDNLFDEAYSRTYTGASEAGRNVQASVSYRLSW